MGQAMAKVQGMCCSGSSQETTGNNTNNHFNNNPKKQDPNQFVDDPVNDITQKPNPEKNNNDTEMFTSRGESEYSMNLQDNQKQSDLSCFLKVCQIGQGAFGKVYKVKKNNPMSKKYYAMKIIKKSDIKRQGLKGYIKVEKDVLQNNKKPFIVDLKYSFQTGSKVYLVMEMVSGGSLYPYLRAIPKQKREDIAKHVFSQVILGMETLHKDLNVIYRDLKPENILVTDQGNIKLTDFGLSKVFNPNDPDEMFSGVGGTQEYFAPEVILKQPWDRSIDIWSLGIFLYEILAGHCPFIPDQRGKLTDQFCHSVIKVKIEFPTFFSEDAKDLILQILNPNPKERLGYKSFQELKDHKFFRGIYWTEIENLKSESPLKKYVQMHLKHKEQHQTTISKLPPRPILETFQREPHMRIEGLSYRPDLMD